ncbi:MAG: hypothetical protein AAF984_10445 [Verrucomicrobiota bacterium]
MKNQNIYVCLIVLMIIGSLDSNAQDAAIKKTDKSVLSGFTRQNLTVPINSYRAAIISIDNKDVVIDGYWEFKDEVGQVLEEPIILEQPAEVDNLLVLALRQPGNANVSITEDGKTKIFAIEVKSRVKQNNTEKEIEEAITAFIGDPGLKIRVLPPQSSIVGRNLTDSFGDEAGSNLFAPSTASTLNVADSTAQGSTQEALIASADFRPTIIMEGEVANDLIKTKALNVAYAYSPNVVNLISVREAIQIRIKVKILQVAHNYDQEIGIEYRGVDEEFDDTGELTGTTANRADGFSWPVRARNFSSSAPFWDLTQTLDSVEATLNLLKNRNVVKILQEPVLTVLNGQPAKVLVGSEVPITTTTISDGAVAQEVDFIDVGTILRITPIVDEENAFRNNDGQIAFESKSMYETTTGEEVQLGRTVNTVDENGIIRLMVQPTISSITSTNEVTGAPTIATQQIETRVALRDGEALVLGGLFDENESNANESVPFVEKIPLLGELFKNRTDAEDRTELIFIIMPKVIGIDEHNDEQSWLAQGNARTSEMDTLLRNEKLMKLKPLPTRVSAAEFDVRMAEANPLADTAVVPLQNEYVPSPAVTVEEVAPVVSTQTQPQTTESEVEASQAEPVVQPQPRSSRLEIIPRSEETESQN